MAVFLKYFSCLVIRYCKRGIIIAIEETGTALFIPAGTMKTAFSIFFGAAHISFAKIPPPKDPRFSRPIPGFHNMGFSE